MKKQNEPSWTFFKELPHHIIMEDLDLNVNDLPQVIQQQIINLDKVYITALSDGIIDDTEALQLHKISNEIAENILQCVRPSRGIGVGIFAGIGIAALALLGINKLAK